MNEVDEKWLLEIDTILNEITEMPMEKMNKNSRRNNMKHQLIILKTRMGYAKDNSPFVQEASK